LFWVRVPVLSEQMTEVEPATGHLNSGGLSDRVTQSLHTLQVLDEAVLLGHPLGGEGEGDGDGHEESLGEKVKPSVLLPHLGNIGHDDPDDEDDCLDKAGTQGDDQEDDRDSLLVAHDHGDDEEDDSDREGDHSDLRADKISRMMTEGLQQEAELVSPS
jgi:hypothetical protein